MKRARGAHRGVCRFTNDRTRLGHYILRARQFVFGILFVLVAIFLWVSLLLTTIDKTMNSICDDCYLIGNAQIFNPLNAALVFFSRVCSYR